MLPRPVARVKDLARRIDLGAKALGAVAGERGLFEQCLPAGIRDVVFGHDRSPEVAARWAQVGGRFRRVRW